MDRITRLLSVSGVTYPDGNVGSCYALVSEGDDGSSAVCVTIKRAAELEREGVPFGTDWVRPEDFDTFIGPDFPMVGEPRT